MKGYVYAIQNGELVKIGRSINPKQRLRAIQTQGGFISENIFISQPAYRYNKVEIACHKKLAKYRVYGEWFRMSYTEAIQCIEQTMNKFASAELERNEEEKMNPPSCFTASFFNKLKKIEEIKRGMLKAEWTDEAISFCFELGYANFARIYDELFMSPAVTLIGTDKRWICYPDEFECHDKEEYILIYDKNAIAKDIGCRVDDVPEWDDYSVIIEEQHRLAA